MSKRYKLENLAFNRRNPNRRKRLSPESRGRVIVGGRRIKDGDHVYITESYYQKYREEIDKYVSQGKLKISGSTPTDPVKLEPKPEAVAKPKPKAEPKVEPKKPKAPTKKQAASTNDETKSSAKITKTTTTKRRSTKKPASKKTDAAEN